MSLFQTVRDALQSSSARSTERSKGAYWCHDCDERVLDIDVEGDEPPACQVCGDKMEFERSTGPTGCAC